MLLFKALFVVYMVFFFFLFTFNSHLFLILNLKIGFVILAFWRYCIYFEHFNFTYYINTNFLDFNVLRAHFITISIISFILSKIWTIIVIFYFAYSFRHLFRCEVIYIHILYYLIKVLNLKWCSPIILLIWIWIAVNTHFFKINR